MSDEMRHERRDQEQHNFDAGCTYICKRGPASLSDLALYGVAGATGRLSLRVPTALIAKRSQGDPNNDVNLPSRKTAAGVSGSKRLQADDT